jgi:hypothetical protein
VFSFAGPRLATMAYHVISFFSRTKVAGKLEQMLRVYINKIRLEKKYNGISCNFVIQQDKRCRKTSGYFSRTKVAGKFEKMLRVYTKIFRLEHYNTETNYNGISCDSVLQHDKASRETSGYV